MLTFRYVEDEDMDSDEFYQLEDTSTNEDMDMEMDIDEEMDEEMSVYGHSDYLQSEYRMKHKDGFYQLDLEDTSTKVFILAVIVWIICAPLAMVWFVMKCCSKEQKYSKVEIVSSGAEDLEKMELINSE